MAQTQNQEAPQGAGAAGAGPANQQAPRGRIVILNALPLNALPRSHLRVDILPVSISELASWVQRRVQEGWLLIHYVRHPATIQALRASGIPLNETPNAGLYTYDSGDILVVVTLRAPQRGQEQNQVRPEDLEAWIVTL